MASRNVEAVMRINSAANSGDDEAIVAELSGDFVADLTESRGVERGVYRGPLEFRGLLARYREVIDELRWNTQEAFDLPGGRALIVNRLEGRGRGSGVEISGMGAQLWTFRAGLATRFKLFQSREDAIEHVRSEALGRLEAARLYFACEARPGGEDAAPLLEAVLEAGVEIVQLREKALPDAELVEAGRAFRKAADRHGALFVLNDRPELVAECGADGVHVGQADLPVAEARRVAPPGALVGLSTHSSEQLTDACEAEGDSRPDLISVGPIWETPTKPGRPGTGLSLIEEAARTATLPWFAIGGVNPDNVDEVASAGAARLVVVRAIRDAEDPVAATRALRRALAVPARGPR